MIFLVGFICLWFGVMAIFITAQEDGGDPDRLLRGLDYQGRICGKTPAVKDQRFSSWPYPPEYEFRVCLDSCNDTLSDPLMTNKFESVRFAFYCIPTVNASIELGGGFQSASEDASRAIGDIFTAYVVILVSGFVALIFAFAYTWWVKRFACCMVLLAILLMIAAGFLLSYVLLEEAEEYKDSGVEDRAQAVEALGWVTAVMTFIFIFIVIAIRDRIRIAVGVIREAGRALTDMKTLLLLPVIVFFCGMAFMVWWISVSLWIFSVGTFTATPIPTEIKDANVDMAYGNQTTYENFDWNEELKDAFAIHFFSLLWNIQFMIYFVYMVSSSAVADWYFSRRDANGEKRVGHADEELHPRPVWEATWRVIRFHLGTVAAGSLIIATIQFIRAVVKYLEAKTKVEEPACWQRWIFKCISCCLWCVECCMDKISKNAFIWCSIYGDNFGTSACMSFKLVWSNLLRAAAVNLVGDYLMLLGKVAVSLATAGVAAYICANVDPYKDELSSIVMPVVVVFLLSWLVASVFMAVYETAIDSTFLCFLVDESCNKQTGNMFASDELKKIIDAFSAENRKQAMMMSKSKSFIAPGQKDPNYVAPGEEAKTSDS